MASVFLMQAVGQISAYAVCIVVVMGLGPRLGLLDHTNHEDPEQVEMARSAVDAIWRVILSVGAIPALIAIVLRRLLPETPRFLAEHASVQAAMETTGTVFNVHASPEPVQEQRSARHVVPPSGGHRPEPHHTTDDSIYPDPTVRPSNFPGNRRSGPNPVGLGLGTSATNPDGSTSKRGSHGAESTLRGTEPSHPSQSGSGRSTSATARKDGLQSARGTGILADLRQYFSNAAEYLSHNSRWRAFLGVITTWYLLDLSVYGLGLDSPRTIATMYLSNPPSEDLSCLHDGEWRSDPAQPDITIYDMLIQNTLRNLQTITTGTLPGSIIILFAIDYVPRATWMGWTFAALAGLFAITGGTLFTAYESDKHAMTLVFYVLMQLLNNLGPNTMTWILPAELFATRYRATFYGVAAAAGKLGAVTIQIINSLAVAGRGKIPFAGMLLGLCPFMLLGAFFSWVWVPEVQEARGGGVRSADDDDDDNRERESSGIRSSTEDEEVRVAGGRGSTTDDEAPTGGGRNAIPSQGGGSRRDRANAKMRAFFKGLVLRNRTLEDIAEDPARGQIIGIRPCIRHAWGELFPRLREPKSKAGPDIEAGGDGGHEMHAVPASPGRPTG